MTDLIDRDKLLNALFADQPDDWFGYIAEFPSAVAPNPAEWCPENVRPKSSIFLCTNCGGRAYYPQNHHGGEKKCGYDFCPHCGARMGNSNSNSESV